MPPFALLVTYIGCEENFTRICKEECVECYGAIFFLLSDGVNGTQGEGSDSTTLTVYYAKNEKLVVFSEHLILVDDIS